MTLMDATLVGVGAMIGAGIFVLIVGLPPVSPVRPSSWYSPSTRLVALLIAMSYAEFAAVFVTLGGASPSSWRPLSERNG